MAQKVGNFFGMLEYTLDDESDIDDRIQALEQELDAMDIGSKSRSFRDNHASRDGSSIDHADVIYGMVSRTPDPIGGSLSPLNVRSSKLRDELQREAKLRQTSLEEEKQTIEIEMNSSRIAMEEMNDYLVSLVQAHETEKRKTLARISELEAENTSLKASNADIGLLRLTITDFENQRLADAKLISQLRTEYMQVLDESIQLRHAEALKTTAQAPQVAPAFIRTQTTTAPAVIRAQTRSWDSPSYVEWESPVSRIHNVIPNGADSQAPRPVQRTPTHSVSPPWALHEDLPVQSNINASPQFGFVQPPFTQHKNDELQFRVNNEAHTEAPELGVYQHNIAALDRQPVATLHTDMSQLEERLLTCNLEKIDLESWLSRLPPNTAGRTLQERRDKYLKERRLGELNREINSLRTDLKEYKRIKNNPAEAL